jgi:hypothetical protein
VRVASVVFTVSNIKKGEAMLLNDKWASLAIALELKPETVQYREMQKAFYAGAFVVMSALNKAGADGVNEEYGARILESMELELSVWNTMIQARADAMRRQIVGRVIRNKTN